MVDCGFRVGIRTAALDFVALFTIGSFASLAEVLARPAVEAADTLEVAFPREVLAFDTTFFTVALMDFGASNLRFLPWRADADSFTGARLRFIPSAFLGPPTASIFAR